MRDIRIVEERVVQPTLFGPPLLSTVYRLADWDTYEPLSLVRYPTIGEAEKAVRAQVLASFQTVIKIGEIGVQIA
jgi:hypothetical protein